MGNKQSKRKASKGKKEGKKKSKSKEQKDTTGKKSPPEKVPDPGPVKLSSADDIQNAFQEFSDAQLVRGIPGNVARQVLLLLEDLGDIRSVSTTCKVFYNASTRMVWGYLARNLFQAASRPFSPTLPNAVVVSPRQACQEAKAYSEKVMQSVREGGDVWVPSPRDHGERFKEWREKLDAAVAAVQEKKNEPHRRSKKGVPYYGCSGGAYSTRATCFGAWWLLETSNCVAARMVRKGELGSDVPPTRSVWVKAKADWGTTKAEDRRAYLPYSTWDNVEKDALYKVLTDLQKNRCKPREDLFTKGLLTFMVCGTSIGCCYEVTFNCPGGPAEKTDYTDYDAW